MTLQHFDNQMLKAEDLPTLPVAVAYSLLRATPHDKALLHKLQRQLEMDLEGSTPFWRRATQAQSLWALACFISAGLTQGQSLRGLMAPFLAKVHTLLEWVQRASSASMNLLIVCLELSQLSRNTTEKSAPWAF